MLTMLPWLLAFQAVTAAAVCPGQEHLAQNPADPSLPGPYTVGAVLGTVEAADGRLGWKRNLTVEAWYPADASSINGMQPLSYDIRLHLPAPQRKKLVNAANVTRQPCDCYRDLPLAEGKFPVVLYIHGTAAFRTASLHQQTHWASRGFIVVAADHPGIQLLDLLGLVDGDLPPKQDQEGDGRAILDALAKLPGSAPSLGALAGHLDLSRVAIVGHSAGGFAANKMGDVADVLIPMSGFSPKSDGHRAKSALVLTAENDTVVNHWVEVETYEHCSFKPRRLASVNHLGHMFCTDLCWIGEKAGGIVQIAYDHGIWVAEMFKGLGENGCAYLNKPGGPQFLQPECGWLFVNYATTAAIEEILRCDSSMAEKLRDMKTNLPTRPGCPAGIVAEYQEQLSARSLFV